MSIRDGHSYWLDDDRTEFPDNLKPDDFQSDKLYDAYVSNKLDRHRFRVFCVFCLIIIISFFGIILSHMMPGRRLSKPMRGILIFIGIISILTYIWGFWYIWWGINYFIEHLPLREQKKKKYFGPPHYT